MTTTDANVPPDDGRRADAVILLGRGGVGAAPREGLMRLAHQVQALMGPRCQVVVGFVDKAAPSLPEALDLCEGASTIVVVPVMAPDEPALQRWLHKVAMRWKDGREERKGRERCSPRIVFAPTLLAADQLPQLLRKEIERALPGEEVEALAGEQWQKDPVAWSTVPEHAHHVLVCTGPRCTALGAVAVWQRLGESLKAPPSLEHKVRVLQTSCQYPCNHGPLAIVYPQGVWLGRLAPATVGEVVRSHFEAVPGDSLARAHEVHRLVDNT